MKTIMLIFGTRPEAIKMAPLVTALKRQADKYRTVVAVSGQHRQMLDQVLDLFGIVPDYDLNIMQAGQDLTDVTTRILQGMREILSKERPDLVIVHGDTSTSTAAALSAFYQKIPVGHVEAGLRTGDIYSPWPEEMNRRITGRIASLHFAPTHQSRINLLNENVSNDDIVVTGNTVIDALTIVVDKIRNDESLRSEISQELAQAGYDIKARLADPCRRLVLITGHRRENFGQGFVNITLALRDLAQKYPAVDFVYPMHLNPNVRRPINDTFGQEKPENVFFIEPLDYLPFVYMMMNSHLIITDSGGIQEEAPSLGKPVLVMRDVTERPEAVAAGTVKLVGTDRRKIVDEASRFIEDKEYYAANQRLANPYGDGTASLKIIEFISGKI